MGMFSKNLDLRWDHEEDGTVIWELLSDLSYTTDSGDYYVIKSGFKTDLASIPRFLWPILPPFWDYSKSAVLHDYLLTSTNMSFGDANRIMRESMVSLGVKRWRIILIYFGVSSWAWIKTRVLGKNR